MNIKEFANVQIKNYDSNNDLNQRKVCITQMKKLMFQFQTLPPFTGGLIDQEEYKLALQMLEREMDFHLCNKDTKSFEQAYKKIKQFYFDSVPLIGKSERRLYFIGLHLLHLLVNNKSTEFSTELEIIPIEDLNNQFINIPRLLNECFMEGKYKRVSEIKTQIDDEHYRFYLNKFNDAVRFEIVRSIEKSHDVIKINKFKYLLGIETDEEMREYIRKECESFDNREIEWKIKDDSIYFTPVIT
jgi:26S proteasome regulatory subunit N12